MTPAHAPSPFPIFDTIVAHRRMEALRRWHAIEGGAFTTGFGSGYDVALVTNFLHHFDIPTNVKPLGKVHAAMKSSGTTFAMTMLTTTREGDAYSFHEIESMCAESGFQNVAHHAVPGAPRTVTIAKSRSC